VDLPALALRAATKVRGQTLAHGRALPAVLLQGDDPLDVAALLAGERADVPINIVRGGKDYSAIRFGDFKLIVGHASPPPGLAQAEGWYPADAASKPEMPPSTVAGAGRFAAVGTPSRVLLFNVAKDPSERVNLAANRTLVREGLARLARYVNTPEYSEPVGSLPQSPARPTGGHG
jgi:hypothetical protein